MEDYNEEELMQQALALSMQDNNESSSNSNKQAMEVDAQAIDNSGAEELDEVSCCDMMYSIRTCLSNIHMLYDSRMRCCKKL